MEQRELMGQVIGDLAMLVDVPFSIDSVEPDVVEAGLRNFVGRALINSVSDKAGTKE